MMIIIEVGFPSLRMKMIGSFNTGDIVYVSSGKCYASIDVVPCDMIIWYRFDGAKSFDTEWPTLYEPVQLSKQKSLSIWVLSP